MNIPPIDGTTQPWWDATRERRLIAQHCVSCDRLQHPPRPVCLACSGTKLGWREMSGAATLDAFTTVHRSPGPGFDPPYVLARVRLAEGPLLLSNLVGAIDGLHCDDPVSLTWQALSDGRQLPVFTTTTEE